MSVGRSVVLGRVKRGDMTRLRIIWSITSVVAVYGLWLAWTAPEDRLQGVYSRIINLHVPSLWLAFLAFGVTAFGSLLWLIRKRFRWDRLAEASVEIGVLFTGIGLMTGMLWGWAVWGTAWDWSDPRLASTAVMFMVYLGYLSLRKSVDDPRVRAQRSAVLGVIAVIQLPLVYFSVNLFRTLHQTQSIRPDGATMPAEMLRAMLVNVGAFTLLYIALMMTRLRLANRESVLDSFGPAGKDVKQPDLERLNDV